jgi:hypothetical protein
VPPGLGESVAGNLVVVIHHGTVQSPPTVGADSSQIEAVDAVVVQIFARNSFGPYDRNLLSGLERLQHVQHAHLFTDSVPFRKRALAVAMSPFGSDAIRRFSRVHRRRGTDTSIWVAGFSP